MLKSVQQSQLRRAPSVGTNASGIAPSVVDAESLAHFPPPPDDIPLTPLREHMPSPSRSVFGGTPPVTPNRKHFRVQASGSSMPVPRRQGSQPGSVRSHQISTSNASSSSARAFAQIDYASMPPVPPIPSSRPDGDVATNPLPNKNEWHEGSSKIIVGRAEERMLSTAFITDLLSSKDTNDYPHASTSKSYPPSYVTNDGISAMSELTYPPSAPVQTVDQFDGYHPSSPLRFDHPDYSQTSEHPESFLTLDPDGRSVAASNGTFDGLEPYGNSVVRTASMSRRMGARGASVVGYAPATLRRVSLTPSGPSSNYLSGASVAGKGYESASSARGPEDDVDAQRLTIPDFHDGPSPMIYSPAQRSSGDFRNSNPNTNTRPEVRQSIHSTRTTKSLLSSFVPRFSAAPSSSARRNRSVKEAASSLFRWKPLPRVPVNPDVSIAAEAEYRKADDALPLPELVNRAGALQGMLEKGFHPHSDFTHNNFNSMSTTSKGDYSFDPVKSSLWPRGPSGRGGTGTMANTLTQNADLGNGENPGQRQNPKTKRVPMTKKQRLIVTGSIAILLLALILGVGLGIGLAKKKQKLPNCPGNLTGYACNLGE